MRDYPNTYYSATRLPASERPPLRGAATADVCVIGGGLAGLSTAWELIRLGRSVVLLEARCVGWGASGRNGGFVLQGWSEGLRAIEKRCGLDHARALFGLSVEGVGIVRDTLAKHALPGCNPTAGKLSVTRYEAADQLQRHRDRMARHYGYDFTYVDRPTLRGLLKSDLYFQALRDPVGFHFHPLNYCLGLAGLIERAGGAACSRAPP
ncbi:NAD(P)/FAD-dependent oxidoreductase [Azospirillum doebereinerae]|uniref:NAD(P)/FAD-dependent oxidoreductase n=1 Tax=Azospirillum doebereinerae TaxID=92933 RepID=UPI00384BCACB